MNVVPYNMKCNWEYNVKLLHIDFMTFVRVALESGLLGDISSLFFTIESLNIYSY